MTLREAFPEVGAPVALPAEPITVKQVLVNARRLIVGGWAQGTTRADRSRYCLLGAVAYSGVTTAKLEVEARLALANTIKMYDRPLADRWRRRHEHRTDVSPAVQIVEFNDRPKTTQRDVIRVLDRAIERSSE